MILAIAIIAGIGFFFSIINDILSGEANANLTLSAILVISTWSCLPIAIIVMSITLIRLLIQLGTD